VSPDAVSPDAVSPDAVSPDAVSPDAVSPDAASSRAANERRITSAARRRLLAAGAVFALASLTRPDGVLFAAVCGVWILAGRDVRGALAFAAGFAALWLPATIWRIAYYGDVFPNTYYAKSAALTWWSQGAFYAKIYFERYWPLLLALPCALFARPRRQVALELALAAVYTLYVMRVGGDFMFGRLLVPVTPFLAILVERGLDALLGRRPVIRVAAVAALAVALVVTPSAIDRHQRPRGITDERDAYLVVLAGWAERADANGARLAELFDGLPISVCFFGAQARLVYRSRVATAIECETGLTDATIAHQTIRERGRVGHEKHAQLSYLLARHVDFVLTRDYANATLGLDAALPDVPIQLGKIQGRVITWDPAIMGALRARGVAVPDVPGQIDRYIAALDQRSDADVRRDWERFRRLYFDRVSDPAREAPFRARLHP
jgi:arabinofuranosyltransferase